MSNWNKLLLALVIFSVCILVSIVMKKKKVKFEILKIIYYIIVLMLGVIISMCWTLFDF